MQTASRALRWPARPKGGPGSGDSGRFRAASASPRCCGTRPAPPPSGGLQDQREARDRVTAAVFALHQPARDVVEHAPGRAVPAGGGAPGVARAWWRRSPSGQSVEDADDTFVGLDARYLRAAVRPEWPVRGGGDRRVGKAWRTPMTATASTIKRSARRSRPIQERFVLALSQAGSTYAALFGSHGQHYQAISAQVAAYPGTVRAGLKPSWQHLRGAQPADRPRPATSAAHRPAPNRSSATWPPTRRNADGVSSASRSPPACYISRTPPGTQPQFGHLAANPPQCIAASSRTGYAGACCRHGFRATATLTGASITAATTLEHCCIQSHGLCRCVLSPRLPGDRHPYRRIDHCRDTARDL